MARPAGLEAGRYFLFSTAAIGILSYEHDLDEPALALWNDTSHLKS